MHPSQIDFLQNDILWLNVVSDTIIAIVFFSIALTFFFVLNKLRKTSFMPLLILLSLFNIACGISHLFNIWSIWHSNYAIHGFIKAITAIISLATIYVLIPRLGVLASLRNDYSLATLNIELQKEIQMQQHSSVELSLAQQQLKAYLQYAPDGILIANPKGEIEYSNDMVNSMFGYENEELTGRTVADLAPKKLRDLINENIPFDDNKTRSAVSGVEMIGTCKNGSEFLLEAHLNSITSEKHAAVIVTLRDITQRKSHEEQARKEFIELAHVSRLSTLGEMATGLAHELNQPLTAISNNLHTALSIEKNKTEPDNNLIEIMQENYDSAQRAGKIIGSLRQLVRKDSGVKQAISLNELVKTTINIIAPEARIANVDIYQELDHRLPSSTLIDITQIQQVVVNLGRNAIESFANFSDSSQPRIIIKTATLGSESILVKIIDNGPGLSQKVKEKLFQPYITSKKTGMGLGLSICRTIIESHGGRLWHEYTSNQNTAFCFTIPIVTEKQ